ncbi:MAG: aminotransferase class V-fold PLP-dependent enzyme, partial [Bacteroidota bacterium]|nr:aminotransferase class V-fold PLP-dependent enzyme [Bacteroidota bacterium]
LQDRIHQRHAGWTSNRNFFGDFFNYRIDFDETARRYENGTQNYLAIAALGESTATLLEVGIDNVYSHLLALTDIVITSAEQKGIHVVTPRNHSQRAGIVTLQCPNAVLIFKELMNKNIVVSVREGMLRIAPHFYTSIDDIHEFLDVLHHEQTLLSA